MRRVIYRALVIDRDITDKRAPEPQIFAPVAIICRHSAINRVDIILRNKTDRTAPCERINSLSLSLLRLCGRPIY